MGYPFIALISGGKDSLFSILHCIRNGHTLVALGNLHPPDIELDASGEQIENLHDADSFMYQTVGHSIIQHYQDALGVPLYRQPINGSTIDATLTYQPSEPLPQANSSHQQSNTHNSAPIAGPPHDEAEDLTLLLRTIQQHHPNVRAISTGAILSTYQRARIESVALRLHLVPLAYLWRYPYVPAHLAVSDDRLLAHMRAVRQCARIVKVASGGLDAGVLGLDVAAESTVARLRAKMRLFRPVVGAVVGEGGEFETLVVQGPAPLWKKKIVYRETVVVPGQGGCAALHFKGVETSEFAEGEIHGDIDDLIVPELFPSVDSPLYDVVHQFLQKETSKTSTPVTKPDLNLQRNLESFIVHHERRIRISNLTSLGNSAESQTRSIVSCIRNILSEHNQTASAIIATIILLKNMEDFAIINKEYSELFTESLPPARVTIAVGDLLPSEILLSVSMTVDTRGIFKQGLHVQGQSYWAPANIGPYSQGIEDPVTVKVDGSVEVESKMIHLAGQIPLVPASMQILSQDEVGSYDLEKSQIYLSLQNLLSVNEAMDGGNKDLTAGLAFFSKDDIQLASNAELCWNMLLSRQRKVILLDGIAEDDDVSEDEILNSPCFSVFVSNLPRNSLIEWWSVALQSIEINNSQNDRDGNLYHQYKATKDAVTITWICVKDGHKIDDVRTFTPEIFKSTDQSTRSKSALVTVFSVCELELDLLREFQPTIVPCYGIVHKETSYDMLILAVQYNTTIE